MTPQSAKAKGRRFQQEVCRAILKAFPRLTEDDVQSRGMGGQGEDIMLSAAARSALGVSIECKNQEKVNIWSAIKQAQANTKEGQIPVVALKRNNTQPICILPMDALLLMLSTIDAAKTFCKPYLDEES